MHIVLFKFGDKFVEIKISFAAVSHIVISRNVVNTICRLYISQRFTAGDHIFFLRSVIDKITGDDQ